MMLVILSDARPRVEKRHVRVEKVRLENLRGGSDLGDALWIALHGVQIIVGHVEHHALASPLRAWRADNWGRLLLEPLQRTAHGRKLSIEAARSDKRLE